MIFASFNVSNFIEGTFIANIQSVVKFVNTFCKCNQNRIIYLLELLEIMKQYSAL